MIPDTNTEETAEWLENMTEVTVGLPALVISVLGAFTCAYKVWKLTKCTDELPIPFPAHDGVTLTDEQVKKMNATIKELGVAINTGASTFLKKEYSYLFTVVCILFILVAWAVNWRTGLCYLAGATI